MLVIVIQAHHNENENNHRILVDYFTSTGNFYKSSLLKKIYLMGKHLLDTENISSHIFYIILYFFKHP